MDRKPDIDLEVAASLFYLPAVGHFAKSLFTKHPMLQDEEGDLAYSMELVLYEACANVIRHAYGEGEKGRLRLKIWFFGDRLAIRVVDYGPGFDPEKIPHPDLEYPKGGGLGLFIIRTAMDWFTYGYSSTEQGNALHMEKGFTEAVEPYQAF
jgi:serine/threonine-protein kinase RsbW